MAEDKVIVNERFCSQHSRMLPVWVFTTALGILAVLIAFIFITGMKERAAMREELKTEQNSIFARLETKIDQSSMQLSSLGSSVTRLETVVKFYIENDRREARK